MYVCMYVLVDNNRNIINENRKEKYKLLTMMNNKKKDKTSNKKEGN